jgi:dynein heavy chain
MFKIFNTVLINKLKDGFVDTIMAKGTKFTSLILDIYERAKLNFLPLPSKIHYMFNLRDVSKII